MLTPLELLDQLRAHLGPGPRAAGAADVSKPCGPLGCPRHLTPGSVVVDPVTGQEGTVIAYGRTHQIVAPAGREGA